MSKRANGEGSIYRLPNGKWRVQVEVPSIPGQPRRRLIRHRDTKMEAVAALQELRGLSKEKLPENRTIEELIAAWMQDGRDAGNWSPSTVELRQHAARKHILPAFGQVVARSLTVPQVVDYFRDLKCGPRIKQVTFDTLNQACAFGVRMEYMPRNPCSNVRRPQSKRKAIQPFEPGEVDRLLKAAEGTRWHAFLLLSLVCGLRQGELFGLTMGQVDTAAGRLTVDRQAITINGKVMVKRPKTEAGIRVIDLPAVVLESLVDHRRILLREGLAGGELVFPAPKGRHMDRGRFRTRVWKPLLAQADLPHRGAHHLRHTYATMALGAGVPPHVVSKVIGHSRVSTTLDLYATALPSQTAEAAAVMQRLFG